MISTSQGDRFQLVMNSVSIARAAPMPSNTAPKQSAARMIHMNMQDIPRVLRIVSSITFRFSRPLTNAAMVAQVAPTAELSTRLVIAHDEEPRHEEEDQKRNNTGAEQLELLRHRAYSRSSSLTVGPRWGCSRQRTMM